MGRCVAMIKKKVCMLGAFATGKTSLVERFVKSIFSEKYLTTVGVKIDKKLMWFDNQEIELLLWDIHGEDEFQKVRTSYLRGAAGYFLVVDGTRAATLDTAYDLRERVDETVGRIPSILLFNKVDLIDTWEIQTSVFEELARASWPYLKTSAKTGEGVEEAFQVLTNKMLED
jgi:small GTP-binding protein